MDTQAPSGPGRTVNPLRHIARVTLRTASLERMTDFYTQTLGLVAGEETASGVPLFAVGGTEPLIVLEPLVRPGIAHARTTGLFHLALRTPDRTGVARILHALVQQDWPLDGAADHIVSEALYLTDPEGNGVEVYADRPAAEWEWRERHVRMATLPLDLRALMDLKIEGEDFGVPASTTMGHAHLRVSSLRKAEDFYCGILGFDVTSRAYPGALFVSANGYHHHLGLNTWASLDGPAAAPDAPGLASLTIRVEGTDFPGTLHDRLHSRGLPSMATKDGILCTRDFDGIGIEFDTAPLHHNEASQIIYQHQRSSL